ncbi:type I-F CRISPR-associated protein Csy2 [Neptunomonas phycophila]|uniref:type I-F CRISPR-associated protein Csy2 n=1 Tax=Neptunomonas phycophila TaxID=1572645 RepID=UPI0026E2428A|nr:type I-F CRISPR-associated protein Csy2 [Neptunomonas phycophila]MDO6784125.1 type I-F CRISPR-associated protein Csy2 [Neptunomonas phycophila]
MSDVKKLLIVPHLRVHNANALSSPYTIGFPAMTAWLGAMHALQRKLQAKGMSVVFNAVGVVCHEANLQTYKGENDFVHSIIGTGNPLDKTGERSSFIEEARCHLDVTMIIEYSQLTIDEQESFLHSVSHVLNANMKIAGGSVLGFEPPVCFVCEEGNTSDLTKLKRKLMPGYAIIERRELLAVAMEQGADALEALIDYLAIHYRCEVVQKENEKGELVESVNWKTHRKMVNEKPAGWLVPIATGFQGISELGEAKNQRDQETPHRFAESLVTLGEFKMPHRINRIDEILWRYHCDGDLYLCHQTTHEHLSLTQTSDEEYSEF